MNEVIVADNNLIKVFENIESTLAEITDIKEALGLRNLAKGFEEAWKANYRSSNLGFEQMFLGWEAKVRSERRMGELLPTKIKNGGTPESHDVILEELGISNMQSHRYQHLAKISEEKFNQKIEELRLTFIEPTTKGLMASITGAHVGFNSGEFEWYTPPIYIESARFVMGKIDLDPASSKIANDIVCASMYYTEETNGLDKEWKGCVWLNPPYSQPLLGQFTDKLILEINNGNTQQACVLINNITETASGQKLLENCTSVCFPKGRIKFLTKDKEERVETNPLQGQMLLYFGDNGKLFRDTFSKFGQVLWQQEKSEIEIDLSK